MKSCERRRRRRIGLVCLPSNPCVRAFSGFITVDRLSPCRFQKSTAVAVARRKKKVTAWLPPVKKDASNFVTRQARPPPSPMSGHGHRKVISVPQKGYLGWLCGLVQPVVWNCMLCFWLTFYLQYFNNLRPSISIFRI